ncbi:DUF1761 domain-containing protein [Alkalihalobacillus sp. TS-13]|uniref:DUF1761 domain-containing protein n=1 Tax=Alkalihalobacillus sp. TS-13 TaxID=2842455 RepID=UPI001C86F240|nr:DUF1761 domain-containing protein [Alkalihalobacillus sp. TS-13]
MDIADISILGIALAAVANFMIGALWYSPLLFANIWIETVNKTREDFSSSSANLGHLLTFLGGIISAYVLSLLIQLFDPITLWSGATLGFLAGIGFSVVREISPTIFEGRNTVLFFISAGYHVVSLTIMGTIVAAFT